MRLLLSWSFDVDNEIDSIFLSRIIIQWCSTCGCKVVDNAIDSIFLSELTSGVVPVVGVFVFDAAVFDYTATGWRIKTVR